jgi:hypothetical protein
VGQNANMGLPNMFVYNNVFYNTGTCLCNNNLPKGEVTGSVIKNNIMITSSTSYQYGAFGHGPECDVDYNFVARLNGFGTLTGFSEPHGINGGNPMFTNVATYDFHLLTGSPAIDHGVSLTGFNYDHDGVIRPQGAAWDMGAFEYAAATNNPPLSPPANLSLY